LIGSRSLPYGVLLVFIPLTLGGRALAGVGVNLVVITFSSGRVSSPCMMVMIAANPIAVTYRQLQMTLLLVVGEF
jgi:hypothetical protein